MNRRGFLARSAAMAAGAMTVSRAAGAQQRGAQGMMHDTSIVRDSQNLFAMDQSANRPVQLPPKRDAKPSMTPLERDALERRIRCQCGCTLDVFTCRTTDFSCQVSPAMHRDVMALVEGGYSAQEIIDAFVNTYGERALMAPTKSGFNLIAWMAPGIAVIIGGAVLAVLLRRWRRTAVVMASPGAQISGVDASTEELARLEAAIRRDDS